MEKEDGFSRCHMTPNYCRMSCTKSGNYVKTRTVLSVLGLRLPVLQTGDVDDTKVL